MPAGCDFICNNINCKYYKSGFSITSPWPLGKIELIIANINSRLPNQEEYKLKLQKWKEEGRKLASLILPNEAKIPIEGYRINMWDDVAKCIWSYDVITNEYQSLEEAILSQVPLQKNGNTLKNFNAVIENGINCLHCSNEMTQSRWFSNNE